MHVLMLSMDSSVLTESIGNSRTRHETYAAQVGRISMVVCNRAKRTALTPYASERLFAAPTNSHGYFNYLLDGFRAAMRFHAQQPIDIITTQDPFLTALIGLALRRRLRIPLIMQINVPVIDNKYFARESRRNVWLQRLARQTVRYADAVRVVNHREQEACIRLGISPDHVCVAPVPPDLTRFKTPAAPDQIARWRETLDLSLGTPVVIWVGRPVACKDLPTLLRAFAGVHAAKPDARLIIAGDVSGTSIPALVNDLGLSSAVRLPGAIRHTDLPALYQIANIYAHSSYYEAFGVVLLEASAAGLPLVSTASDGACEIIQEGQTGLTVPIGDSEALGRELLALLDDSARARHMGEQACIHVNEHFDPQEMTARWIGMWRAVANGELPCAS